MDRIFYGYRSVDDFYAFKNADDTVSNLRRWVEIFRIDIAIGITVGLRYSVTFHKGTNLLTGIYIFVAKCGF